MDPRLLSPHFPRSCAYNPDWLVAGVGGAASGANQRENNARPKAPNPVTHKMMSTMTISAIRLLKIRPLHS
jgi:hypothetical protein